MSCLSNIKADFMRRFRPLNFLKRKIFTGDEPCSPGVAITDQEKLADGSRSCSQMIVGSEELLICERVILHGQCSISHLNAGDHAMVIR